MQNLKIYIIMFFLGVMFNLSPFMVSDSSNRSPASTGEVVETTLWDYQNPALVLH